MAVEVLAFGFGIEGLQGVYRSVGLRCIGMAGCVAAATCMPGHLCLHISQRQEAVGKIQIHADVSRWTGVLV